MGLCSTCSKPALSNQSLCKDCNDAIKIRYTDNRKKVLEAYGNKCQCCGITDKNCLQIDHIKGGGCAHRKSLSINFNKWLIKNNFPEGYQILCANCNSAKGRFGICPHNTPIIHEIQKDKLLCFEVYGGAQCRHCGETKPQFLEIDHIHNNGNLLRKADSRHTKIYRWLRLNNYPDGYQILCANCNRKKALNELQVVVNRE